MMSRGIEEFTVEAAAVGVPPLSWLGLADGEPATLCWPSMCSVSHIGTDNTGAGTGSSVYSTVCPPSDKQWPRCWGDRGNRAQLALRDLCPMGTHINGNSEGLSQENGTEVRKELVRCPVSARDGKGPGRRYMSLP